MSWGAVWAAVLLALGLYLTTLSRNYSADSLIYALAVESGQPAQLVDPYHLLLHPFGLVFYGLWRLSGWTGGALLPLQVLNAAGGALSVGLVLAIARRIAGSGRAGWLAAAGFAVSGGIWLLSVEAEFVTIPLASQLLVLWLMLEVAPERAAQPGYAILVGLAIAFSVLTYLTGLLLLPVAVTAFLMQQGLGWSVRWRQVGIVVGTMAVVLVPVLALATPWTGVSWLQAGALWAGGGVQGQIGWSTLPHGAYAFLRSLALYPNLAMNDSTRAYLEAGSTVQRLFFGAYYSSVAVLAAVPVWLLARRWRWVGQSRRRVLAVLLCWAVLYAAFAVYWVPGDISFWAPVLAAWWLLSAVVLTTGGSSRVRWQSPAAIAVIVLLLVGNGALLIWPRHDLARNQPYHVARSLAARTVAEDLIITRADDLRSLYVLYFAGRQVLPLHLAASNGEVVRQALIRSVDETLERGGRVFVVGIQPDGGQFWAFLPDARGEAEPDVRFEAEPAWQVNGEMIWQLLP